MGVGIASALVERVRNVYNNLSGGQKLTRH